MTPSRMLRPALVCLTLSAVGLMTSSCGMVEGDPHRFETLAETVADIRLDGSDPARASNTSMQTVEPHALAPADPTASAPAGHDLRVEVMDPHDLWDARDGLRRTIREETSAIAETAGPTVARAVVQQVSNRMSGSRTAEAQGLRPAVVREAEAPRVAQVANRTTIQLGAYSSEAAARSAWTAVSNGKARQALVGLSPMFERVMVNGRPFTRLKVAAPTTAATAICHAVAVSDPWCARRT